MLALYFPAFLSKHAPSSPVVMLFVMHARLFCALRELVACLRLAILLSDLSPLM